MASSPILRPILRNFLSTSTQKRQLGLVTFYNKHRRVTDPARQDPDYFEKEAEKIPIAEQYVGELKRLWLEKVGSERELVFKAQDRLVGRKAGDAPSKWGLPELDMSGPRLDYAAVDVLETAPEAVRKIYSLEHASARDLNQAWKLALMRKVRRDDLDAKSLPAKIAWSTAVIRNWNRLYAEHEVHRKKPTNWRIRPRATWISHPCYLMINYRRKLLRLLRQNNEEEFQKCIDQLQIAYHVEKRPEHVKTRKAWSKAQIERRVQLEKERQLEELHQKLLVGRSERTAQIDTELGAIEEEERQLLAKLHQLDVAEGKTVANVVGKFEQDHVGEWKEVADNGRFFF